MMIRYVHTNIVSPDWRRLAAFYHDVFGCEPVPPQRDQRGDWLSRGTGVANAALQGVHLRLPGHGRDGPTLEIYQYDDIESCCSPAANRRGLGHLAFEVDDVSAIREAILNQGGAELGTLSQTTVAGVGRLTFIYMTDPDGNILEIQHWE